MEQVPDRDNCEYAQFAIDEPALKQWVGFWGEATPRHRYYASKLELNGIEVVIPA